MKTAIVIVVIGLLAAITGVIMNVTYTGLDANIGAGMMLIGGLAVAAIGTVILIVSLVVRRGRTSAR